MALVAQYQRNPLLAAGPAGAADPADPADTADNEDSADATAPSYTELPASDQPGPGLVGGGARHRTGPASSRPAGGWRQWLRSHLAWVGWVSVGAALVVTGVILGASLSSSSTPSPSGLPPIPDPPATVCGTVHAGSGPGLCMVKLSEGTSSTAFVVQGNRFAPGASVTFSLSEVGPPPAQPDLLDVTSSHHATVGPDGTFTVPVSELHPAPFELGEVTVHASASGGGTASTQFIVLPSGSPPGAPASG